MNLLDEMPVIKRARGYRLYCEDNSRLLDLCLDGGVAVMGHRKGSASLYLKNVVSRGLFAGYPSIYGARLKKALGSLYPQFNHFTIFSSRFKAESLLVGASIAYDTVLPLGRLDLDSAPCSLLVLPLPGSGTPAVVGSANPLPFDDDLISPFLLSAVTRAIYDLIEFLPTVEGVDFSWFSSSKFRRDGAMVYWKTEEGEDALSYQTEFLSFLKSGVLLSPDPKVPSFLPIELSDGEKKLLIKLFA